MKYPPGFPDDLAPMLRVAYITGGRVRSEIQPLQWRQVDFTACEVRLDPGTTKNKQGRTFPFTNTLREVLVSQRAVADELQRTTGTICPWVFHRDGRPIKTFVTAWRRVSRQDSPRSPENRGPKPDPGRNLRTGRHDTDRPPDTLGVRPLQHRQQSRPAECRSAFE